MNEGKNHYVASGGHGEIHIDLASSEEEVLTRLGPPDNRIRIPAKSKWIYEKFGLHIEFANGKVVNVVFK